MATNEQLNKRQSVIASLTALAKFIHVFTDSDDTEKIKVRFERLDSIWAEFNIVQSKIEEKDNSEINKRLEFEDIFYDTKAAYQSVLSKTTDVEVQHGERALKPHLVLPKLKLQPYGGNYQEWKSFQDMFKSIVHENRELSTIQKFFYLRSHLEDEALKVIESIPVTEINYTIAWQTLCERYDRIEYIANNHMKSLFEQTPMKNGSVACLRRLVTETKQHLRALGNLNVPVEKWDMVVIYNLSQKLDNTTRREWEFSKTGTELPTLNSFYLFLEQRCRALEALVQDTVHPRDRNSQAINKTSHIVTREDHSQGNSCAVCKGEQQRLYNCTTFQRMNTTDRINSVKEAKLCYNCLRPNCNVSKCTYGACKVCGKKHNSLLHYERPTGTKEAPRFNKQSDQGVSSRIALISSATPTQVLLSTSLISVTDVKGNKHSIRVLLDSASQVSFVTTTLVNRLGLREKPSSICIGGINQTTANVNSVVDVQVASRVRHYQKIIECYVLEKITTILPTEYVPYETYKIPTNIQLADPYFNKPAQIEMLLGADVYLELLRDGRIQLGPQLPNLQNTVFGWVVSGRLCNEQVLRSPIVNNFMCIKIDQTNINEQLSKFWELEEFESKPIQTKEERECEALFKESTYRNEEGRFVVKIPFKEEPSTLGDSYTKALKRFNNLETRLLNKPEIREQYEAFLKEYLELNHMKQLSEEETTNIQGNYLPHHAVMKETSTTTKLRVVFDASMQTTTGKSLNEIQYIGPVVQQDLISIVLRFRVNRFVFTADICKMYRQILVNPTHTRFQRIIWRNSKSKEIEIYELKTVTYGTASAPYLATKCLEFLANDECAAYPLAATVLKRDFYMDDCLTGANSLDEARELQRQLIKLLQNGGFELRKWCANYKELLVNIPIEYQEAKLPQVIEDKGTVRTLGLLWHPTKDQFQFDINVQENEQVSKRQILSAVAKIFDPLGLLGPVVIMAKLFLQRLWQDKYDWDDKLPDDIQINWKKFYSQLKTINDLRIDRHILCFEVIKRIEMHGFADASEKAYGAAIYLRCIDENDHVTVKLVCAKSRLAPLKQVSLPRLELCAALLLARLQKKSLTALDISVHEIVLWTDSSIVLAWLAAPPTRWTNFVANRVNEIQELAPFHKWKHIASKYNPADLISRGMEPGEIQDATLWWSGPEWLQDPVERWPITSINYDIKVPEKKPVKLTVLVNIEVTNFLNKYSTWPKLLRITAFILRFVHNTRCIKEQRSLNQLSVDELQQAENLILKLVQAQEFVQDIGALKHKQPLHRKSKLLNLRPFLDNKELIRVGGRLRHAAVTADMRHPIVLPARHHITKLIATHLHKTNLHGGQQALLCLMRQQYWPLGGRTLVRKIIHQCVTCYRARPHIKYPIMGQLPSVRVIPARPFLKSGVDFCGPISIKQSITRNAAITKAYIAVFICMVTKAVHLELVSSLSTESFVAALKRFMARRGKCQDIYSDNGTNFVGAQGLLSEYHKILMEKKEQDAIAQQIYPDMIQWHFIPPHAPHFGGLWEAGVKNVKHHLQRIMGNKNLLLKSRFFKVGRMF